MPIKRATTNNTSVPTMELARLRKGAPKTGNKPGQELDYFRVDWNEDSPYFKADPFLKDRCQDAWTELYGNEPALITGVQFFGNSIEAVFPNWYSEYTRSKASGEPIVVKRCDGERLERFWDGKQTAYYGNLPESQRPACTCNPEERTCRPDAKLVFILPEFIRLTGVPGHFLLITSSIVDVMNIYSTLEFSLNSLRRLQGVAFNLSRQKMKIKGYVKHGVSLSLGDGAAQQAALQLEAQAHEWDAPQLSNGNGHTTIDAPALPAGNGRIDDPETIELAFLPRVYVKDHEGVMYYGLTDIDETGLFWTPNPDLIPVPYLDEFDAGEYGLNEVDTIPANMRGRVTGKKLLSVEV